ncbi:HAD family hydrolase [Actinomadura sp. HBU206391]|uniref:HAD family hydrolase n=1 Tax=Actinomadura sp. HBU206391 TaxID=2731692 RepID=UPI00164FE8CE|nr:HAD-IA family hydrolase [Actinomadura sp. HBU206391]MBC6461466.1 HAD family hydrolase [Actinomadura sp. HBU206391]
MSDLIGLVASVDAILLDFDGPVCHLFAGYSASIIAEELRAYLVGEGSALDERAKSTSDPLALLQWTSRHRPELLGPFEQLEDAAEYAAAETAKPTEHAADVIDLAIEAGRRVAIVSNNSRAAIERYLELQGLSSKVTTIVSRITGHPELMKPNPRPLIEAAENLGTPVEACVLVGDSVSDITAAGNAGARSIGYAKNPSRADELSAAGAEFVVSSMGELAVILRRS